GAGPDPRPGIVAGAPPAPGLRSGTGRGRPVHPPGFLLHTGVFDPGGDSRDGPDPNNPVPHPGDALLSIVSFKIQLYRGEEAAYRGTVGVIVPAARLDDDVRIELKLSSPAYCYLIAFNPNGDEQLCYPPDVAAAPPPVGYFKYPPVETRFFP